MSEKEILIAIANLDAKIDRLLRGAVTQVAQSAVPLVASDAELDGPYGDLEVKDPPSWKGPSFTGMPMSACSPEFLDSYAGFKGWQAGKDAASGKQDAKGRPTAPYRLKDAALARGWAARLRTSRGPMRAPQQDFGDTFPE